MFPGLVGASDGKESACSAVDPGSIPGSGQSPGIGNGNPLWYSCLGNSKDRGDWHLKRLRLDWVTKQYHHHNKYHRLVGLKNKFILSQFWRLKVYKSLDSRRVWFLVRTILGLQMAAFFLSSSHGLLCMWEGPRDTVSHVSSYVDINLIGPTLIISFNRNYFLT